MPNNQRLVVRIQAGPRQFLLYTALVQTGSDGWAPSFLFLVVSICTTSLTILRSAHTVYLWVLCGSENKQRLFYYTTLSGFSVCVCMNTDIKMLAAQCVSVFLTSSYHFLVYVYIPGLYLWRTALYISLCQWRHLEQSQSDCFTPLVFRISLDIK
jgi:hypothetical protein